MSARHPHCAQPPFWRCCHAVGMGSLALARARPGGAAQRTRSRGRAAATWGCAVLLDIAWRVDQHPTVLHSDGIGLHGNHAGRCYHLAGSYIELAAMKIALDDIVAQIAF